MSISVWGEPQSLLVLASQSPRRRELLASAGATFEVLVRPVDETPRAGEDPAAMVVRLAEEKARAVAAVRPAAWILGADTTVVLQGENLGKPTDRADARRMLHSLRGKTHEVLTGHVLLRPGGVVARALAQRTEVTFGEVPDEVIERYLDTPEPYDKAGSYGLQAGAGSLIAKIVGSPSNVIGLDVHLVHRWLYDEGALK